MNRTQSQSAQILACLRSGATLTPLQALRKFNSFRLGARIYDLRRSGHNIEGRIVKRNGKRFSQYWLATCR